MWNYWRKFLDTSSKKRVLIKCLQLEVSTICQLSCLYCPRTQATGWPNQFMSWEIYKNNISPYFDLFEMIFLQGWGEPLTNPYFWDMVRLAKSADRKVGFVTNGIRFDENAADQACDLGVDLISFTFTGASTLTHEFYRAGANFSGLRDVIQMLADRKVTRGIAKPSIGISFTMMRENLHEFPDVVRHAITLGANQVTASHMDCIPSKEAEEHSVFLNPKAGALEHIKKAAELAHSHGILFKAEPPLLSGEILACDPNPLHMTLFIRADGTVVPCHQMALPPEVVPQLYFHGSPYKYCPITLGNVSQETLSDILNKSVSRDIFAVFRSRSECATLPGEQIPDAPDICKKCYKLYGA